MPTTQRPTVHSCSSASVELLCVDPGRVGEIWPYAAPLLKAAIARTDLGTFAEIERQTLAAEGLLWIAWSGQILAAATTIITATDRARVCVLTACGGRNMARWLPLLEKIEAHARDEGCSAMRIFGRRGWSRVLDSYKITHVVLERQL
jgi:hypothetical protein